MKYILLIYGAESSQTEGEYKERISQSLSITDELEKQGKSLTAPPHTLFSLH